MRRPTVALPLLRILLKLILLALVAGSAVGARAQGVELTSLQVARGEGGALVLEYSSRLTLSHALEDALQRGVPMYFTAHVTVLRNRWYWRDERVARIART